MMEDIRFPIGRYNGPGDFNVETIQNLINEIDALPKRLTELVSEWPAKKLDTPYRHDGWTVRQLIHHLTDSHLNAYLRFKRVATEDNPTILPYNQAAWANLPDSVKGDIRPPLLMLSALHQRWVIFLRYLSEEDFSRKYTHPEHSGTQILFFMLGLYAWHSNHHYTHIEKLSIREGW
jgi:DinB family protein